MDSGRSKGWGLVTYATPDEAQNAISTLDGCDLDGRNVKLKMDRGKDVAGTRRPPRARRGNRNENEVIIYINNLAASAGWRDVKNIFTQYNCSFADVRFHDNG